MSEMIPSSAFAELSDDELRKLRNYWIHWRDGWDNARRYGLRAYCCEGEVVEVLLSAGVAEAERQLTLLRQEAERRPRKRDAVRKVQS